MRNRCGTWNTLFSIRVIKVVPRATSDKPNTWAEFVILNCSKSSSRMTDMFHPPSKKKNFRWFHEAGCDFFSCILIVPIPRHESLAGCVSRVFHANIKAWWSGRCVIVCDRGMHLLRLSTLAQRAWWETFWWWWHVDGDTMGRVLDPIHCLSLLKRNGKVQGAGGVGNWQLVWCDVKKW